MHALIAAAEAEVALLLAAVALWRAEAAAWAADVALPAAAVALIPEAVFRDDCCDRLWRGKSNRSRRAAQAARARQCARYITNAAMGATTIMSTKSAAISHPMMVQGL